MTDPWEGLNEDQKYELLGQMTNELHRRQPARWVADKLGGHLWSVQQRILMAVQEYPRVAVPSCHSAGKSYVAAAGVCWWTDVFIDDDVKVLTTAPTESQVKAILWHEINRMHAAGNLPGRMNLKEWWNGNEMIAMGRKPSDHDPTAFQGIHARHLMITLDEAGGIPKSLWDAAESMASNAGAHILAIGNPDDPNSEFAKKCKSPDWHVIPISAYETPNFTDEECPQYVKELLVSPEWVEARKREWGETSPVFIAKVLGQFPESSEDTTIPYAWVKACQHEHHVNGVRSLGFDVAGDGSDRSVITGWDGNKLMFQKTLRTMEPDELISAAIGEINDFGADRLCIDDIGVGYGIRGGLDMAKKEGKHTAEIVAVNVAKQSTEPTKFKNLRAQLWWEVGREAIHDDVYDLTEASDELIAELCQPKWFLDTAGRIQIQAKDDIRKENGKSPDLAESFLLGKYDPRFVAETDVAFLMRQTIPGVRTR